MRPRFYLVDLPQAGIVTLDEPESRHLSGSRRLVRGDLVELFDGKHPDAREALVRENQARSVELELTGQVVEGTHEPLVDLTLATCVPKSDRFDWLVEKAVEVGVSRLVPLRAVRSVVEPRVSKLSRLTRLVIEASKQCGRNRLMRIEPLVDWNSYAAQCEAACKWLADTRGEPKPKASENRAEDTVALAIGPEGAFSPDETERALSHGWRMLKLGRSIMRVETAAIVGAALLLSATNEQSG